MSWEDVENAMQSAVAQASGFPTSRVYWSYQSVNEPEQDYVAITFGGERIIGIDRITTSQDLNRPNGQEMKQEISGVREVPFDIECYSGATSGNDAARRVAELIRTRMRLSSIRYNLRRYGLVPFDAGPVNYVPDMPTTNFRGRALCTIRCYVPVTDCIEYTGYIARVKGTFYPSTMLPRDGATGIAFDSLYGGTDPLVFTVYFGCATPATIDQTFIKALSSTRLSAIFADSYSFIAGDGIKKDYIAFPSAFGTPSTFIDTLTGFSVPSVLAASAVSVTDAAGTAHDYDVWATVDTPVVILTERLS